ncbi:MAG: pyruvate kinase [Candidatus Omnitrophota bacterium]
MDKTFLKLLSHSDGMLLSNKGLHVKGIHGGIPFLFEKDKSLIGLANEIGAEYVSLSFVRDARDILEAKKSLKKDIHVIAKVETRAALENLPEILGEVESVLMDRGDLSTEIDMLELSEAQDEVIGSALRAGKNIYLATQFLKNMEKNPIPLISEIMDLCKTVKSGVSGIQLSEETAVGRYPIECVKMVFDVFRLHGSGKQLS